MDNLAKFRVLLPRLAAAYGEDLHNRRIEQAFAEYSLPDHSGGSEQDDVHGVPIPGCHCCSKRTIAPRTSTRVSTRHAWGRAPQNGEILHVSCWSYHE